MIPTTDEAFTRTLSVIIFLLTKFFVMLPVPSQNLAKEIIGYSTYLAVKATNGHVNVGIKLPEPWQPKRTTLTCPTSTMTETNIPILQATSKREAVVHLTSAMTTSILNYCMKVASVLAKFL